MRLPCKADVYCQVSAQQQRVSAGSAIVSIGKCKEESMIAVIRSKDKLPSKYKLSGNVERVFVKFVSSGKASLQLRQPRITISISELRSFLSLLTSLARGQSAPPSLPVLSSSADRPPQHLTVQRRQDYPTLGGFAPTLERLALQNCFLRRLDPRVLSLKQLRVLDLASNRLTKLDVSSLPLSDLCVAHNFLTVWPRLPASLRRLDVSGNRLREVPGSILLLSNLIILSMAGNLVQELPHTLHELSSLRELYVDNNRLTKLPQNLSWRRLLVLSISGNPLDAPESASFQPSSLFNWTGCVIRRHLAQCIVLFPLCLQNALLSLPHCSICGHLCASAWYQVVSKPVQLCSEWAASFVTGGQNRRDVFSVEKVVCSAKCLGRR